MNGFKYRDIISKIDTDKNMDQRIKNKLLNHDANTVNVEQKRHNNTYDRSHKKSLFRSLAKVTAIRPALTSIIFLAFVVVAILSVRANLSNGTVSPTTDIATSEDLTIETNEATSEVITQDMIVETDEAVAVETNEVLADENTEVPEVETNEILTEKNSEISEVEIAEILPEKNNEIQEVEMTKSSDEIPTEAPQDRATVTTENAELPKAQDGDFYFAWFDVQTKGDVKASIPNLIVRFHGTVSSIDPNDLTDVVLTRDGNPIDNDTSFTGKINPYKWGYEEITDFYFKFTDDNREPGNYALTGKYKGEAFKVYNKIIESQVSDIAANPDDLKLVSWAYYTNEAGKPKKVTELVFGFEGSQNSFYQSDLTELKITLNNKEIPFSFGERVFRYLEAGQEDDADTSYNLVLNEPFTMSGNYVITGKYQGKSFTSQDISIP